jgi:hypothetical protein
VFRVGDIGCDEAFEHERAALEFVRNVGLIHAGPAILAREIDSRDPRIPAEAKKLCHEAILIKDRE